MASQAACAVATRSTRLRLAAGQLGGQVGGATAGRRAGARPSARLAHQRPGPARRGSCPRRLTAISSARVAQLADGSPQLLADGRDEAPSRPVEVLQRICDVRRALAALGHWLRTLRRRDGTRPAQSERLAKRPYARWRWTTVPTLGAARRGAQRRRPRVRARGPAASGRRGRSRAWSGWARRGVLWGAKAQSALESALRPVTLNDPTGLDRVRPGQWPLPHLLGHRPAAVAQRRGLPARRRRTRRRTDAPSTSTRSATSCHRSSSSATSNA